MRQHQIPQSEGQATKQLACHPQKCQGHESQKETEELFQIFLEESKET